MRECELDLVMCMLNSSSVTEFDFLKWSQEDRQQIFKKLVSTCPRLRKVTLPVIWLEWKGFHSGADELDTAWTKWRDLREADFRGRCLTNTVLQLASIRCPKLESVLLNFN